jgi:acyl-CoA thioesterase-1
MMIRPFHVLLTFLFLSTSAFAADKKNSRYEIVILGDSVTAGYGILKEEAFPFKLEQNLRKLDKKNVTVKAAGVSGSTSASGVARLKWLMKNPMDLLVIELGANDGLRGQAVSGIKANLKAIIQEARKQKNIEIKLIEVELPENYGKKYRSEFKKIFKDVSKEENVELVEFFFKRLQEKNPSKKSLLLADGLHPNADGHTLIAEELTKILLPGIP